LAKRAEVQTIFGQREILSGCTYFLGERNEKGGRNVGKRGKICAVFSAFALLLAGMRGQWQRAVTTAGEAEIEQRPMVALTFDDGPRRSTTTQLLDGLAQRGAHATFFLVGEMIPGNEDLVERMEEEGHQIGTHSYDHVKLTKLNGADFARQVDRTQCLLTQILGREGFVLRPPYGDIDNAVEKRSDSALILWSIDPEDWKDKDTGRIVEHIVSRAQDGDVILLHDIYATSVEAALQVVDRLHEKGFLFVTVDELAGQRCVALEKGKVYRSFYP